MFKVQSNTKPQNQQQFPSRGVGFWCGFLRKSANCQKKETELKTG
jgi:hypothetical protein